MLKMTHLTAFAAVVSLAVATQFLPQSALAQAPQPSTTPQPAPAATPPASTDAATAPAPAPKAPAAKAEAIENPYGFQALLRSSDLVAKITLAILAIMSMGSWYIIITKVYEQAKMGKQAKDADKKFWKAPSVREGARHAPRRTARTGSSQRRVPRRRVSTRGMADLNPGSRWRSSAIKTCRAARRMGRLSDGRPTPPSSDCSGVWGSSMLTASALPGSIDRQGRGSGGRGVDHDCHRSPSRFRRCSGTTGSSAATRRRWTEFAASARTCTPCC